MDNFYDRALTALTAHEDQLKAGLKEIDLYIARLRALQRRLKRYVLLERLAEAAMLLGSGLIIAVIIVAGYLAITRSFTGAPVQEIFFVAIGAIGLQLAGYGGHRHGRPRAEAIGQEIRTLPQPPKPNFWKENHDGL